MAERCSFCGATSGPFSRVEDSLRCRCVPTVRPPVAMVGPVPVMTRAEMRESLDLLPTWALEQKATATAR